MIHQEKFFIDEDIMRDPIFTGEFDTIYYHLENAACKDKPTRLFFSQEQKVQRQAKRICRGCPERERCFEMALHNEEVAGVWGGVVFRRGKPDKNDLEYWNKAKENKDETTSLSSEVDVVVSKGKIKNGRRPEDGFSRYPMLPRVVPKSKKK
jgi:hypothetical protein